MLSGAIEKKPAPGDHEPHFNGNRLYKGGDPNILPKFKHAILLFFPQKLISNFERWVKRSYKYKSNSDFVWRIQFIRTYGYPPCMTPN
jgi:hypothetical protein